MTDQGFTYAAPGSELDRVQDEIVYADTAKALVEIAIGYAGLIDVEVAPGHTVGLLLLARAQELDEIATEYAAGAS